MRTNLQACIINLNCGRPISTEVNDQPKDTVKLEGFKWNPYMHVRKDVFIEVNLGFKAKIKIPTNNIFFPRLPRAPALLGSQA